MAVCPNCKRVCARDAKFCDKCGTPLPEIQTFSGAHGTGNLFKFDNILNIASNFVTNYLKIIIASVAVLLVVIIIALSFFSVGSSNSITYLKDDELYYMSVSQTKGKQVTKDLLDGVTAVGNLDTYTRISDNGKYLFFIDEYDGAGYDLYFKQTNKLKKTPQKIISDVNIYDISNKGTKVTYIKDGGDLYQHNLREQSEKIDDNVMNFVVSDTGNRIVYFKVDSESTTYAIDVYLSKSGKKGEPVLTEIENICKISDDLKYIYYTQYGTLYKAVLGSKPEKLATEVGNIINIYDSGECYYTRKAENGSSSLYYLTNKTEPKKICDNYYSFENFAKDSPALVYYANSNADNSNEFKYYLALGDAAYELENGSSFSINDNATEIRYTVASQDNQNTNTLYSASISNKGVSKAIEIDNDIHSSRYLDADKFMYIKNYIAETSIGDIYINDKLVAEKAYCGYTNYCKETKTLLFYTDIDESNNGTLKAFKSRKPYKIRDDVYIHSLITAPGGEILFLTDYKNGDGVLYVCKNRRAKKVDIDVSSIIRFKTNQEYDESINNKL